MGLTNWLNRFRGISVHKEDEQELKSDLPIKSGVIKFNINDSEFVVIDKKSYRVFIRTSVGFREIRMSKKAIRKLINKRIKELFDEK